MHINWQVWNIVVEETWSFIDINMTSTQMVAKFETYSTQLIKINFPEKAVTILDFDKPYITEELKLIRRQRQRTYQKHGKSAKYIELKDLFDKNQNWKQKNTGKRFF